MLAAGVLLLAAAPVLPFLALFVMVPPLVGRSLSRDLSSSWKNEFISALIISLACSWRSETVIGISNRRRQLDRLKSRGGKCLQRARKVFRDNVADWPSLTSDWKTKRISVELHHFGIHQDRHSGLRRRTLAEFPSRNFGHEMSPKDKWVLL